MHERSIILRCKERERGGVSRPPTVLARIRGNSSCMRCYWSGCKRIHGLKDWYRVGGDN